MILSDRQIREEVKNGSIGVDPNPSPIQYQPASLDLRLGNSYTNEVTEEEFFNQTVLEFEPGTLHLTETLETVSIPPEYCGLVGGRSSVAREGLMVHLVAGWCDPGFTGSVTLEVLNLTDETLTFRPGERVAQIIFMEMSEPPETEYGELEDSKYQGQSGPTRSRR